MTNDPFRRKFSPAFWLVSLISLMGLFACQPPKTGIPPQPTPIPSPQNTRDSAILRLATGEWEPYTGRNLPHNGCDAWVVSEAFALVGIQVEYTFFPWARAYQQAQEGRWDGTLEWADTPEHRQMFYLSADYISEQEWRFFYRADRSFDWNSLNDLAGKRVGLTSGYVYSNMFESLKEKGSVKFETASSDIANFQRLLAGRIDVFPMENRVGQMILEKNFTAEERSKLKVNPKAFDAFKPYLLLTRTVPGNEQNITKFNQGFEQLKQSGRYAEIMRSCAP